MLGGYTPRSPAGYDLFTASTTGNPVPGDGLAVLIQQGTPHLRLNLVTDLQAMAFRIRATGLYTICNLYLPPGDEIAVHQLINLVQQLPRPFILAGDFNSRHHQWGDTRCNRLGNVIESLLLEGDVVLLNSGSFTHYHIQTNSYSAIDITLCSPDLRPGLEWSVSDDLYGSDHYPVTVREVTPGPPAARDRRYIYEKANWSHFLDLAFVTDDDVFSIPHSVEAAVEVFCSFVIEAADASIPASSGNASIRKRIPWWTRECTRACVERKRALRRYQRSGLVADRISYNRARAIAKHTQKEARKLSWRSFVSTINVDTPMSKIWNRIRKMRGIYRPLPAPYFIENDTHITDPEDVATILADHYASVSAGDAYAPAFCRHKAVAELQRLELSSNGHEDYNSSRTFLEFNMMLSRCSNTAAGDDKITYQLLKHCHETAQRALLGIFNRVWLEEAYPDAWLSATVLSFPKPAKTPTDKVNHRPIALTSCIGKLMEKIVNCRLVRYLESKGLLPQHQFGFRRLHSTSDALLRVTNDILTSFTSRESTLAVFFDMEKAYDKTWRFGIIRELHGFGLRGRLLVYISNFLSRRSFRTKIGSVYSSWHIQEEGVPQGSVLSCTLFSVAINGILSVLPADVHGSLYVDDFMIYCSGHRFPGLERNCSWLSIESHVGHCYMVLSFPPAKLHVFIFRGNVACTLNLLSFFMTDLLCAGALFGFLVSLWIRVYGGQISFAFSR